MKKVLLDAIKKYKIQIILHAIFIGIHIYILTIPPKLIGNMIDLLYNLEENKQAILNITYQLLGICILFFVVRFSWKSLENYVVRGTEKDINIKLFQRFLKLKLQNIQNIKNGEIMSYFVKDVNEIRAAIYRIMTYGSRIIFTFIIAIYQMASGVNINLTIAVMLPIIVATYLVIKIKKYVETSFKKSQDKFTELSEYIQESTDSIRTTKAYACEGEQLKEFIRKNRIVRQSNNAVDVFSNLLSTCTKMCFGICYSISLIYGSKLVLDGKITIGELVAFNGYIGLFVNPVNWIPELIARVKRMQISYKRLDAIFDLEVEKINVKEHIKSDNLNGSIEIRNLTFSYPGSIDTALEDINIEIKVGQTLGIIGTIGSGKTTLMNLLTRLYTVPYGKILIDGKDINEIPIEVLRNNICYVTQDNFLFSTTLRDNISLFKEEYDDSEIKESTRKAVIYDDIQNMPNGLQTVIGEGGGDLSGGQKQRVAISRAFLKNSRILIFDDTFSALDNKTSEKLIDNIRELTQDKTCIIISNKVSDVKNSDNIIVLDESRIVEQGTHEELMEKNGIYYEFFEQQASREEENILA